MGRKVELKERIESSRSFVFGLLLVGVKWGQLKCSLRRVTYACYAMLPRAKFGKQKAETRDNPFLYSTQRLDHC